MHKRHLLYAIPLLLLFGAFAKAQTEEENEEDSQELDIFKVKLLKKITDLTLEASESDCVNEDALKLVGASVNVNPFTYLKARVDLVAELLESTLQGSNNIRLDKKGLGWLSTMVTKTLVMSPEAVAVRLQLEERSSNFCQERPVKGSDSLSSCSKLLCPQKPSLQPWFKSAAVDVWDEDTYQVHENESLSLIDEKGRWTFPYFSCCHKKWFITYVRPYRRIYSGRPTSTVLGKVTADVDVTMTDFNQCDLTSTSGNDTDIVEDPSAMNFFRGTHKCHRKTSFCVFQSGHGWEAGGYKCLCKPGYYSKTNAHFNGSFVEVAWENRNNVIPGTASSYEFLYQCLKCSEGCPKNCTDNRPCLAVYNWPFRIALLTISSMCIVLTITMMALVYKMRSVKVFKMASPTFLHICLFGCIVMYLEMAAIFPILNVHFCVFTKWTRHMGFCITFSSLLMKTWRVSLTYRVKSAHKIKLTDKQLIQWMTPVALIMAVYLASWTISDPPVATYVGDQDGLRFKICVYNYWDHAIALGEMMFLLWGVKVCYGVRKAESFFDEAKCISFAVYNITLVNVIMASVHLFLLPKAGPDSKYFFGFLRTQLSTTTTIALVFGPKFLRMLKGTGDQLDHGSSRSSGATASFDINGLAGSSDQQADPLEENEELKEEIQKLAAQIEFMKIVHMETNNRHLKPKVGGYFTEKNNAMSISSQSPSMTKTSLSRVDKNEQSSAEIATERV